MNTAAANLHLFRHALSADNTIADKDLRENTKIRISEPYLSDISSPFLM